jgi:molybdopterin adenylyltransferase
MFSGGVLTISDKGAAGERRDVSGTIVQECLRTLPITFGKYEMVPDDQKTISSKLVEWADQEKLDIILTTGGTGLSPRDVTPEATLAVIKKVIPGLTEAMRMETMKHTPMAMLSRAIAGSRGRCLIINLPGSPAAVKECLQIILPVIIHALEILSGKTFEGSHRSTV